VRAERDRLIVQAVEDLASDPFPAGHKKLSGSELALGAER
jgi:hypothetical protein